MTKEETIERLESIKESYEMFVYRPDNIHLNIEALGNAIEYLKSGLRSMTNREKIFEDFGINLESSCICTSDETAEECVENGDCFACEKWLNAPFKERR